MNTFIRGSRSVRLIFYVLTGIAIMAAVSSLGCARRQLSRDIAANAITASAKFPIADSRTISREYAKADDDGHIFTYGWAGSSRDEPTIQHFIEARLLTSTDAGHRGNIFSYIRLDFAENTKGYEISTGNENLMGIKLCDLVFGEITGIQANDQAGTAVVEYSLRRANWTPFGTYYKQTEPATLPDVIPSSPWKKSESFGMK